MTENLIPALIALAGVLISVFSSLFISIRQARIETKKLRDEYLHRYAGKLFEKRLEEYPKIIEALVVFFHKVNIGIIKGDDLSKLLTSLLEWDACNSTFLSAESQHTMHNSYHLLAEIVNYPNEQLSNLVADKASMKQLRNRIFELYLALKNDLGIYSFKSPAEITEFIPPGSVKELSMLTSDQQKLAKNKP